ncbi:hypothetical protein [Arthrobacter sp. ISL-30]|uniref:hypothetical protein n=1 Tax=Arthrobacter sp. ISL-30 TaxID=2819109 RepID=UPI001BE59526|nr:hypothetical protein [Arthrobacter sp. ISL-30]MBT2514631.1 hypothetical protein [Arthrobacter sp. ISL-30]
MSTPFFCPFSCAIARTVAHCLGEDTKAIGVLFAVYTSTHWEPGQTRPDAATIAALTGVLAERPDQPQPP